jgi:hypothetical protein
VVGLILDGPSPWLRPIARRPLPPKTTTHGNVTTQDNDLVIDFTPEIEGATNTDVNLFAAQVAWSLPTRLDGSLRLQVNGRDLNVDGAPAVQDAGNWTRYNPHGHKPTSLYYLTKGGLKRFVDQAGNNQAQPPPEAFGGVIARTGVVSAAVSLDETALALVKGPAGSQTLYLGDITGKAKAVATGAAIGRPSWGGSQDAVLVPIDGTIHQVEVTGNVVRLPLPGLAAPVRAVRASLDGTRIALVAGDGANARAYVGLIDRTQDAAAPVISNLRLLRSRQGKTPDTPLIARIQDIGWSGPTTLSVAGQEADGTSAVRSVTIDAALEPGPVRTGLRPGPVTLAVSPLTSTPQTEYAEVAGQLYQGGQRSWSPLTSLTDVQRPFYPG